MTLWMMVTEDKYELPLAVADSASELARIAGCKPNNVSSCASKFKHRNQKQSKFYKIEIDEGEDGECE